MATEIRKSGIGVVGDVPWGTHFCQFYETKDDLLEVLVPYFKAGLQSNESCVWVVTTLTEQEAGNALRQAVPDFERYLDDNSLEIFQGTDWYRADGAFDVNRARAAMSEKLDRALTRGHSGLRVTGDEVWLRPEHWGDFNSYEDEINRTIVDLPMICLCSYPLAATAVANVPDVTRTHQFTLARRKGSWGRIETSGRKQAKSEIQRLNEEPARRAIERTKGPTAANQELKLAYAEIDKLRQRPEFENQYLREGVRGLSGDSTILGSSHAIRGVLERIDMVAPTDATVLILGRTGVGEELVARNIHERSLRRQGPLVKVNCTAIPRELFESEFFGHVKGAFSGALKDRMGRFQLADGGTLFLDELGSLPLEMQPKLLRVLQDGEFQQVGSDQTRHVDVRIIAATNRDLKSRVRAGEFREDLYYRLSVFPIEVPPLRDRKEDIPILAEHFLERACRRFNRPGLLLSEDELHLLQNYDWPGNVRELQNVVERAVIVARAGKLHFDIPLTGVESSGFLSPGAHNGAVSEKMTIVSEEEMRRMERENIARALQLSNGRIYGVGGAAEMLGIKPSTLSTRIRKLGLK